MKRGELWWASLPDPVGSGPGFRRPVLVVQANAFNNSRISTVIVAIVTSNLALEHAPGNVRLTKADSSLPKASIVNVSQILTLDRSQLTDRLKAVPGKTMQKVDAGLHLALGL